MAVVQQYWFYTLNSQSATDKLELSADAKKRLETVLSEYNKARTEVYKPDPEAAERSGARICAVHTLRRTAV